MIEQKRTKKDMHKFFKYQVRWNGIIYNDVFNVIWSETTSQDVPIRGW